MQWAFVGYFRTRSLTQLVIDVFRLARGDWLHSYAHIINCWGERCRFHNRGPCGAMIGNAKWRPFVLA
jgi:hypothetical protein